MLPETRRLLQEVVSAGESGNKMAVVACIICCFCKLAVKLWQLLYVIVRGHLAEQVSGRERKPGDPFQLALERYSPQVRVNSGAANHVLDGSNVAAPEALLTEQLVGEISTPFDVRDRVFRPGAFGIAPFLQIPAVVKQNREDSKLEQVRGQARLSPRVVPAVQKATQAESSL